MAASSTSPVLMLSKSNESKSSRVNSGWHLRHLPADYFLQTDFRPLGRHGLHHKQLSSSQLGKIQIWVFACAHFVEPCMSHDLGKGAPSRQADPREQHCLLKKVKPTSNLRGRLPYFYIRQITGHNYRKGKEKDIKHAVIRLDWFLHGRKSNSAQESSRPAKKQKVSAGLWGDDRQSVLQLTPAFFKSFEFFQQNGIFDRGSNIKVRGQAVPRASLITALAEPLNIDMVLFLDTATQRAQELAQRMVIDGDWDHGVCLTAMAPTASGKAESDLGAWEKMYSDLPDVIQAKMTAPEIKSELLKHQVEWPSALPRPRLPSSLQTHVEGGKIQKYWSELLDKWSQTACGTDKKRAAHMLAEARRAVFQNDPTKRPSPPSVQTSGGQYIAPGVIGEQLGKHGILRAVPRNLQTVCALFSSQAT